MIKITKLQDIEIYQDSLLLAKEIYIITKNPSLKYEYSLCDQIRRASMSICANIAEGYGRYYPKDFANFLSIALGSCNETIAFLDLIHLIFPSIKIATLQDQYIILSKRIFSFRSHLLTKI